jgi:hypothetical protein
VTVVAATARGAAWRAALGRMARARRFRRLTKNAPRVQWRAAGMFVMIKVLPPDDRVLIDRWLAEHR